MIARRGFLAGALSLVLPARARAAGYPARTVRLLAGQAPGGQTDAIARAVAHQFAERWQVAVVVENHGGASGTIAARAVAQAPSDGYTLLVGSNASLVLAPSTIGNVGYDTLRDFAPVGRVARVTYALVVRAGLDVATLHEFVALARRRPGAISVATAGPASSNHVIASRLAIAAGIEIFPVPYKGGAPALQALLAGEVDATVADVSSFLGHADAGSVRLLAMVGAQRSPFAPAVPTLRESGYRGVGDDPWYGILAPAATPAAIVDTVAAALRATVRDADMRRRFSALGYAMFDESPAEFSRALAAEIADTRESLARGAR